MTLPGRDDPSLLRAEMAAEEATKPPRARLADRPCLNCRRPFLSTWCGNRLCEECRKGPR